jgi:hypothetical protein
MKDRKDRKDRKEKTKNKKKGEAGSPKGDAKGQVTESRLKGFWLTAREKSIFIEKACHEL